MPVRNGFIVTIVIEHERGYMEHYQFEWEGESLDDLFSRIDSFNKAHADYAEKHWPKRGRWPWSR